MRASAEATLEQLAAQRADPGHAQLGQLLDRIDRSGRPAGRATRSRAARSRRRSPPSSSRPPAVTRASVRAPAGGDLASIADAQPQDVLQVVAVAGAEARRCRRAPRRRRTGTCAGSRPQRAPPPSRRHDRRARPPPTRLRSAEQARDEDHAAAGRAARSSRRSSPSSRFAIQSGAGGQRVGQHIGARHLERRRRFGRVLGGRADRERVDVERRHRPEAELAAPRSRARPSRSPGRAPATGSSRCEELERRPRRAVRAGAERAPGVDDDRHGLPAPASIHGGPTQSRPTRDRAGGTRASASSQPGSHGLPTRGRRPARVGVAREDDVVAVALLLDPAGEELQHAGEAPARPRPPGRAAGSASPERGPQPVEEARRRAA